jgi:hypothetical protein
MSEIRTKYFKVKSSELCIKSETEDKKKQLYRFKTFLEDTDREVIPNPRLKNINYLIIHQLNGRLKEFFSSYPVVLEKDYLIGQGTFIRDKAELTEISIAEIGELYGIFTEKELETFKDMVLDYSEQGEDTIEFHRAVEKRYENKGNQLIKKFIERK